MTKTRVCSKGHAVYKGNHYQNKPPQHESEGPVATAPILETRHLEVLSHIGLENEDEELCIMTDKTIPRSTQPITMTVPTNFTPIQIQEKSLPSKDQDVRIHDEFWSESPKSTVSDERIDSNQTESEFEASPIFKRKHPHDTPRKPLDSDSSSLSSLPSLPYTAHCDERSVFV